VAKAELPAGFQDSADRDADRWTSINTAGRDQQLLSRKRFQLVPEFVCTPEQGNVRRVLPVGKTDDASQTMR